ncbi:Uncharacterised protein [uncultured Clostridium sp.]|nr:Uncharacterised protein [uncultured Clostridium sp.]
MVERFKSVNRCHVLEAVRKDETVKLLFGRRGVILKKTL